MSIVQVIKSNDILQQAINLFATLITGKNSFDSHLATNDSDMN